MTDIEIAEKRCQGCGEVKHLSEFHRDRDRTDGRAAICKPCALVRVAESRQKRRERMGEEAWLESQRQIQARHREKLKERIGTTEAPYVAARRTALERLKKMFPEAFAQLLREERAIRGLDPDPQQRTDEKPE